MGVRPVERSEFVVAAVLTAVFVASVVWRPLDEGGFVLCLFNKLTGLPCPGCGLTRSFCALGHGELGRAVAFHPLGPLVFVAALAWWGRSIAAIAGLSNAVDRFDAAFKRSSFALAGAGLLLCVWIVRLTILAVDGRILGQARGGLLLRLLGVG
jgi:hypothetical protein